MRRLLILLACLALTGCTMGEIVSADNTGYGDVGLKVPIVAPLPGCQK